MRTVVASLALLVVVALGVTACGPGAQAPVAGGSPAAPAPTPVPTAPAASGIEPGLPSSSDAAADLVVRLRWCVDTCTPQEATIVMDDGRVAWNEPNVGVRQGRLSPEGIAWVREQLDATGLLDQAGSYDAQLRPGAQPLGGGATSFAFTVSTPTGRVRVMAGIPGDPDERYWIVPEPLRTLADLGGRMMDADGWIPADLWLEASSPYEPQEYLLQITLNPHQAADAIDPHAVVDADRVPWPLPGSIDSALPAAPGVNDSRARCLVLDADTAGRVDAAQQLSGSPAEPRPPFASRVYLWARGGGSLNVEFQSLLPDEHDCASSQYALD